jgi:hypothetical protein
MSARLQGTARWLAILAIALQSLWPLLAQAKPRSVTLVPICTVGGETHYVELETGGGQSHEEHCKACPVGAAALASRVSDLPSIQVAFSILAGEDNPAVDRFVSYAHSRAPPSSRLVAVTIDKPERKNEKAVDLRHRGARDAMAGRGVVRRGVLLG